MLKEVTEEQYLNLLEKLDEGIIPTTKEFYKLLDVNNERRNAIIKILEQVDEKQREKIFEKILSFGKINELSAIISTLPIYAKTEERIDFLIENISNIFIFSVANLLQFDFLFEDKKLVEKVLQKTDTEFSFSLQIQIINIVSQIKEKQEEFENGERNIFIEKGLDFTNLKHMEDLLRIADIEILREKSTCLDDIIYYCNTREDVCILSNTWNKLNSQNRLEPLITIMEETHKNTTDALELDRKICNIVRNINSLQTSTTYTDEQFNYVVKNIKEDEEEFKFFYWHFNEITDPNSLCYIENPIYNTIKSIENKEIRKSLLDAFTTSLASFITLDELIKLSSYNKKELKEQLKDLAIRNKCLDYLQKYTDFDIENQYFNNEFINYISQENLTKEQLIAMKGIIIASLSTFDGEKMVINIPQDKVEGKVIKIGGISTDGKHD